MKRASTEASTIEAKVWDLRMQGLSASAIARKVKRPVADVRKHLANQRNTMKTKKQKAPIVRTQRQLLNDVQSSALLHLEHQLNESAKSGFVNCAEVTALAAVVESCHGPTEIPLSLGLGNN